MPVCLSKVMRGGDVVADLKGGLVVQGFGELSPIG